MSKRERRAIEALCAIYASRLLGLYMVLPVLSPYADRLPQATSLLTGLSLGIYGATQAIFQVPFGTLSDRIGRRGGINIGLVLFAGGSILAATAREAHLLVLGRALQGSGAITSVILALIGDMTREEVRTQAMAQVGIWIAGTFGFAVLAGPMIAGFFGVPVLFWITAAGAMVSLLYVNLARLGSSSPGEVAAQEKIERLDLRGLLAVLRQPPLLAVDVGIFLLHTIVTVLFVVMPFNLDRLVPPHRTWVILVPAVAVGLVIIHAVGRYAKRERTIPLFFLGASLLPLSSLVLAFAERAPLAVLAGLLLFVIAIAVLEPILASLLSIFSDGPHRGTASGVYSLAQYGGTFIGGVVGGAFLHGRQGTMFLVLSLTSLAWMIGLTRVCLLYTSPS
ncbi:MAG: MFS transporter, partial [Candidatus Eisenbacteria bacterium]|nr:MFS transporter [Candidatus Eisenbacteria bacterium]